MEEQQNSNMTLKQFKEKQKLIRATKQKIRERLQSVFMFSSLDETDLEIVINAMDEAQFNSGDVIIKQGDNGECLYVIESGTLNCHK